MRHAVALAILLLAVGPAAPASSGPEVRDPRFRATIAPIDTPLRSRMTSWRPGCPVALADLRLLTLSHWGFDGRVHSGQLIVHEDQATAVVRAMRTVFSAKFPVRRMRLVDAYGASDDRSMAADNTSAFNCRYVSGSRRWSEHAYGRAIDINPIENPYVVGAHVSPPAGTAFTNRFRRAAGMIHAGDAVVRAFASVGWRWGGSWSSSKDYQHFSASGR